MAFEIAVKTVPGCYLVGNEGVGWRDLIKRILLLRAAAFFRIRLVWVGAAASGIGSLVLLRWVREG